MEIPFNYTENQSDCFFYVSIFFNYLFQLISHLSTYPTVLYPINASAV